MDLRAFLQLLNVSHGPTASGEYMCRCPAHDDRTASLCVNQGEKGIVIKCQAGCTTEAICDSLGIKIRDLFTNVKPMSGEAKQPPKPPPPKPPAAKGQGPGEVVCAYVYRDAQGKPLFEVVRYKTPDGGKTFRQRRPDPDKPGRYSWSVPDTLRDTIYRLPEVLAAIRADTPVYVVEGEKDADNMASLGYIATTNAGGAGKWRPGNSEHLHGADVIIIPDCDTADNHYAGQAHGQAVAAQLRGIAKRVRVIDLKQGCPEIPGKGDITDFFHILGREAGQRGLQALVDGAQDWAPSLRDQAIEAYNSVAGYHIDNGCISVPVDEGYRKLTTFIAAPRAVVTRDDGVTEDKVFLIEGWAMTGARLKSVRVPAAKFAAMNWVGESWDFAANIMPGTTTKDKLRYVIVEVGNKMAQHITEYTHTGWRRIDGQWVYLYQGGAIGGENITVELGSGLTGYTLAGDADIPLDYACRLSHGLNTVMSEHIAIPLLGMMYLAPVREFLAVTGNTPSFSLFLMGGTGTRKSTASALALSHFGDFNSRNLPASFNDTANYVRAKAFLLKDMPIVVDDYHPVTNLQERKRMEATAQSLSRAFGDGAERGRMRSDLSLQESKPPRGVAILSGEDAPNVGESGTARYYIVNVGMDDVPTTEELTEMQNQAKAGALRKAMRGYIRWLLVQADELPEKLQRQYIELRRRAMIETKGAHSRVPEAIAHMMLGYQMMLMYMREQDVFDDDDVKAEMERAWRVITANSTQQSTEMREERPSKMFTSALSELLTTKAAAVRDLTDHDSTTPSKGMVGYMDARYYYLLPETAYTMVCKMYGDRGQAFPLSFRMLYRQMRVDELLEVDERANRTTKPKTVDGKTERLLWIRRDALDGPKIINDQTKMALAQTEPDEDPPWPKERD